MLGEETTERFARFDVLPKDVRRANPKGRDGFRPALRYSPLTEVHSAARLVPRAGRNPSPSRVRNKC